MNRALIFKTVRDHRLLFGLAFLCTVIIPILVILAFSSAPTDLLTQWLNLPFVRNPLRMLLGEDIRDMLNRTSFAAFGFVHPLMLSIVWAFLIVICTQVPSAEIDRGTADLLLSLPISRLGIYVSVSVVVFGFGVLLAVGPWLGAYLTDAFWVWKEPLQLDRLRLVIVNHLAAIWAVAGVGMAVSAATSRRGVAVAILFGWLLISFALNFLGAMWKPAERLVFLSLLDYFRPLLIVRDASLNLGDIAVLVGVAATGWIVGAVIFARRDVRTT
ncbi:MAG: ABC transporter permease subunit [Phycisphaerae bacterium]|nr:ABC transporter permease subunit [Phycisphaerae bacterium]